MSRCVVAAAAFVMFAASPVFVTDARAQDGNSEPRLNFVSPSALPAWQPLELAAENTAQLPAEVGQFQAPALPAGVPIVQPYRRIETGQSPLLMSLYVSTAFTQALDIHSTLKALGRGGVETNPMLSGLTGNRGAFVAVKAAVAAGSIYAASRLAKRNKVAAIVSMVAINTAYGFVAYHNYKVANRLQ
jgi:hypothetical protein